jgi:catechol 2,3-dioxygenase-like lactoylglutathione lyase family enzyme
MVTFGRVAPSIYVCDIVRSLDFYRDILGFSVVFPNGSPVDEPLTCLILCPFL